MHLPSKWAVDGRRPGVPLGCPILLIVAAPAAAAAVDEGSDRGEGQPLLEGSAGLLALLAVGYYSRLVCLIGAAGEVARWTRRREGG